MSGGGKLHVKSLAAFPRSIITEKEEIEKEEARR